MTLPERPPILGIMGEPVRKLPIPGTREWDDEESPEFPRLVRAMEGPDGEVEFLDVPLTPELFLYQELGDKIVQRPIHWIVCADLFGLLRRRYASGDALVLSDAPHLLGQGPQPLAPDVSVTFGPREDLVHRDGLDVKKDGVPSLIIEILSPDKKSIREVDTKRKPRIYGRAGIPEYLRIDPPRPRKPGFKVTGHRLDPEGRYRKIKPDAEGYLLSETTGLLFPSSAEGERLTLLDARTRLPLPYPEDVEAELQAEAQARRAAEEKTAWEARARRSAEERAAREAIARREEEAARRSAEEKAAREAIARREEEAARRAAEEKAKAAEAELARLREELERFKKGGA